MTSRIPPSRRDPDFAPQRAAKVVQAQTPGAGRVAQASPVLSGEIAAMIRGKESPAPATSAGLTLYVGPAAPTDGSLLWFDTAAVNTTAVYPTGANSVILYTNGSAIWAYTNQLPSGTAIVQLNNYINLNLTLLSGTATGRAVFYNASTAGSGANAGSSTGTVYARTAANAYIGDITAGAATIQAVGLGRLKVWTGSVWAPA